MYRVDTSVVEDDTSAIKTIVGVLSSNILFQKAQPNTLEYIASNLLSTEDASSSAGLSEDDWHLAFRTVLQEFPSEELDASDDLEPLAPLIALSVSESASSKTKSSQKSLTESSCAAPSASSEIADILEELESIFEKLVLKDVISIVVPEKFPVGSPVWALLEEDNLWHEGEVVDVQPLTEGEKKAFFEKKATNGKLKDKKKSGSSKRKSSKEQLAQLMKKTINTYEVKFLKFGVNKMLFEDSIIHADGADIEDDLDDEEFIELLPSRNAEAMNGKCVMCKRDPIRLTFHHLIPKETHKKWIKKKKLPQGIGSLPGAELNTLWLNKYGIMVCRPCHTHVHRLASNIVLAQRINTLDKVLEEEDIQKWIGWVKNQRAMTGK